MTFLFGDKGGGGPAPKYDPVQPTPAPPPPDRSDAEIREEAARQRRRYGLAGTMSSAMATGGMGVPSGSTYSAVTALLGGGARA